jgi:hypothetical protein
MLLSKLFNKLYKITYNLSFKFKNASYKFNTVENERMNGTPCVNSKCKWYTDIPDAQNCCGEYGDGDPCVSRCKQYIPLKYKKVK